MKKYFRIDEVMSEKGIKNSDICKHFGWSAQYVSNMKRGEVSLSIEQLYRIAGFLGCRAAELVADFVELPVNDVENYLFREGETRKEYLERVIKKRYPCRHDKSSEKQSII